MKNRNREIILKIAKKWFHIKSFKKTNTGEDFFETSVWSVQSALEEAYSAGYKDAINSRLK